MSVYTEDSYGVLYIWSSYSGRVPKMKNTIDEIHQSKLRVPANKVFQHPGFLLKIFGSRWKPAHVTTYIPFAFLMSPAGSPRKTRHLSHSIFFSIHRSQLSLDTVYKISFFYRKIFLFTLFLFSASICPVSLSNSSSPEQANTSSISLLLQDFYSTNSVLSTDF